MTIWPTNGASVLGSEVDKQGGASSSTTAFALEARDPDRAERLVREHTMGLAAHVERHGDFLDARVRAEPQRETLKQFA